MTKTKSNPFSIGSRPVGVTLIEVMASIVLVSTLLVMVLNSWTRQKRQLEIAQWRSRASTNLDQLMADWFLKDFDFSTSQFGTFANAPELAWRSQFESRATTNPDWHVGVIRVSVYRRQEPTIVLSSVDLLAEAPHAE